MTVTNDDYRVALKQGDVLRTTATYDSKCASWYESMGIMVLWYADGIRPEAKDPFVSDVYTRGLLTHGHLAENRNHGGAAIGLPNPLSVLDGSVRSNVDIEDFTYAQGDLSLTGKNGRTPVIRPGQSLKFTNLDAVAGQPTSTSIYHTVTACRAPCNGLTGIAYPLADGKPGRMFDSGELGYGPGFATPAAERNTWKTPANLPAGTYSYFCRVHPFMRGAFRVKGSSKT
jgi:plastocyanin